MGVRRVAGAGTLLLCARQLAAASPDQTYTIGEVLAECQRRGTRAQESTIRTYVAAVMCANTPDNHAVTYRDLYRVDHGRYRLVQSG